MTLQVLACEPLRPPALPGAGLEPGSASRSQSWSSPGHRKLGMGKGWEGKVFFPPPQLLFLQPFQGMAADLGGAAGCREGWGKEGVSSGAVCKRSSPTQQVLPGLAASLSFAPWLTRSPPLMDAIPPKALAFSLARGSERRVTAGLVMHWCGAAGAVQGEPCPLHPPASACSVGPCWQALNPGLHPLAPTWHPATAARPTPARSGAQGLYVAFPALYWGHMCHRSATCTS